MLLIHIKTNRLEYKFEISGKYTVIQGDSATGKTTFFELVSAMYNEPKSAQNVSGTKLVPISSTDDDSVLQKHSGVVFVLDEFCRLFKNKNISNLLRDSNNYFIIINRDEKTLGYLPIHVDNIFYMKTSGKYHTIERLYDRYSIDSIDNLDTIITEDKKSGYLFIKDMLSIYNIEDCGILLEPSLGDAKDRSNIKKTSSASKIVKSMEYHIDNGRSNILIIYDASAFGAYINSLDFFIKGNNNRANIYVLDWESFEWYILGSKVYNEHYSLQDLDCNVESLEQFSTLKLSDKIERYSKDYLNKCLRRSRCNNCKKGSGCRFRLNTYKDLIYGEVKILYDFISSKYLDLVKGFNSYIENKKD